MGSRHPFERRSEKEKRRIVHEVNQGIIGIRAACRKYGLNRNTLRSWLVVFSLPVTDSAATPEPSTTMPNSQAVQTLTRQVKALTKVLAQAELKISSLQTVIEVAEEEYDVPKKLDSKDNLNQFTLHLQNVQQWQTLSGVFTMLLSRPRWFWKHSKATKSWLS